MPLNDITLHLCTHRRSERAWALKVKTHLLHIKVGSKMCVEFHWKEKINKNRMDKVWQNHSNVLFESSHVCRGACLSSVDVRMIFTENDTLHRRKFLLLLRDGPSHQIFPLRWRWHSDGNVARINTECKFAEHNFSTLTQQWTSDSLFENWICFFFSHRTLTSALTANNLSEVQFYLKFKSVSKCYTRHTVD